MQIHSQSGSIGIRRHRLDDVPAVFDAVRESLTELCPWMGCCHPDYSTEDTRSFVSSREAEWESGREFDFAIIDVTDGTCLGGVGLNQINRQNNFANLGYWVRSTRAGQGVAPAAVRLIAQVGFRELGLGRLEIVAAAGNRRSQRVAEKAGATREGLLRNRRLHHGGYQDAIMYSIITGDPDK